MRSLLDRFGKATDLSAAQAARRIHDLRREIRRVEGHLADERRRERYSVEADYLAWRKRAECARAVFQEELTQRLEWVESQKIEQAVALLREARGVLKAMEVDEVELQPEEQDLMARLDDFFLIEDQEKADQSTNLCFLRAACATAPPK